MLTVAPVTWLGWPATPIHTGGCRPADDDRLTADDAGWRGFAASWRGLIRADTSRRELTRVDRGRDALTGVEARWSRVSRAESGGRGERGAGWMMTAVEPAAPAFAATWSVAVPTLENAADAVSVNTRAPLAYPEILSLFISDSAPCSEFHFNRVDQSGYNRNSTQFRFDSIGIDSISIQYFI